MTEIQVLRHQMLHWKLLSFRCVLFYDRDIGIETNHQNNKAYRLLKVLFYDRDIGIETNLTPVDKESTEFYSMTEIQVLRLDELRKLSVPVRKFYSMTEIQVLRHISKFREVNFWFDVLFYDRDIGIETEVREKDNNIPVFYSMTEIQVLRLQYFVLEAEFSSFIL